MEEGKSCDFSTDSCKLPTEEIKFPIFSPKFRIGWRILLIFQRRKLFRQAIILGSNCPSPAVPSTTLLMIVTKRNVFLPFCMFHEQVSTISKKSADGRTISTRVIQGPIRGKKRTIRVMRDAANGPELVAEVEVSSSVLDKTIFFIILSYYSSEKSLASWQGQSNLPPLLNFSLSEKNSFYTRYKIEG